MQLLKTVLLSLAAAAAFAPHAAEALPTSAAGSCSGTSVAKFHGNGGAGGAIAATQTATGYTVTISCPGCGGGTFSGFVINPSTGTLTPHDAATSTSCNGGAALSHNSAGAKTSLAFDWTGTGSPTFSAVFVGADAGKYFTATAKAVAASPSPKAVTAAATTSPKPSTSAKPSASPKTSGSSPSPSAAAVAGAGTNAAASPSPAAATGTTTGTAATTTSDSHSNVPVTATTLCLVAAAAAAMLQ